jgi:hypothetical protein
MKTTARFMVAAAALLSPVVALPLAEATEGGMPAGSCYVIDGEVVCPPEDHPTLQQMSHAPGAASAEPVDATRGALDMPGEDGTSGGP